MTDTREISRRLIAVNIYPFDPNLSSSLGLRLARKVAGATSTCVVPGIISFVEDRSKSLRISDLGSLPAIPEVIHVA